MPCASQHLRSAMRQGSFWDLPFCRLFVGVRNFRLELEIEKFKVSSCAVSCSIKIVELSIGCATQLVDFPLGGGDPTWRATALEMGN